MDTRKQSDTEAIQRIVARTIATQSAGYNLALIGGFRYRFLDESIRTSDDIDYHWAGNLEGKQKDIINSFRRILLPEVMRRYGYSGRADAKIGPEAESPIVKVIDLAFWKDAIPHSRIEIPVEITRIVCADPIEVRTFDGTIYATISDGDMIESKVIAIFNRIILQHRDMVDVFLFQNRFLSDSKQRLATKFQMLKLKTIDIEKRILDFQKNADYHARAVQEVIDTQFDPEAAAQTNNAGGGKMVFNATMLLLRRYIKP